MKNLMIILLFGFLASCGSNPTAPAKTQESTKPIDSRPLVLYGDSLAYGTGGTIDEATKENTLGQCLKKSTGRKMVNLGKEGATSEEALKTLDQVIEQDPGVVIVSLGGNDVMHEHYWKNYPEDKTFKMLTKIYETLKKTNATIVHLGLNPPMPGAERLAMIESLAKKYGVLFAPAVMKEIWGNKSLMADQLHPNDAGYERVCQKLIKAMKK